MTLDCIIDGKALSLSVNSCKPLLQILSEDVDNHSLNSNCHGKGCGNCLVLVEGQAVLSCLIPAFRLKDANIQTFEGFSKTRAYRDIERAYQASGNRPCPNCYASRTLLIESILQRLTRAQANSGALAAFQSEQEEATIIRELSLNTCQCTDTGELLQIVELALSYRRRKNVVRRA